VPESSPPRVSVVLPAYRSHETIGACLDALRAQTFRDFEVVVVNSSADGETERIVSERYPEARFVQSPVRLLPHAARNRGVEAARGDLLVFSDPDCEADEQWLQALSDACSATRPAVCGAMALADPTPYAVAVHLAKFAPWLPGLASGLRTIAPTANACYTRDLWERIGPFRADVFSGDTLLSWKAAAAGATPWFEPAAVVAHRHAGSAGSFLRERLNRGAEFGRLRAATRGWTRGRSAVYIVATPALALGNLIRCVRYARQAGWAHALRRALPLLVAAEAAWALGEARGYAAHLRERGAARR
jgi:GT2 family glycosyltransferase